ncbi:hypothetical protein ACRRTK_009863 [Alexandromys fortis]
MTERRNKVCKEQGNVTSYHAFLKLSFSVHTYTQENTGLLYIYEERPRSLERWTDG